MRSSHSPTVRGSPNLIAPVQEMKQWSNVNVSLTMTGLRMQNIDERGGNGLASTSCGV